MDIWEDVIQPTLTCSVFFCYYPHAAVNSLTHVSHLYRHWMRADLGLTSRSNIAGVQVLLYHVTPNHNPTSNGCVPLYAHPCQNLMVVLVFSRLMGMKWYFTTVLFCLSPANPYFFREKTHNHHLMTMARRLGVVMGQVFYLDPSWHYGILSPYVNWFPLWDHLTQRTQTDCVSSYLRSG